MLTYYANLNNDNRGNVLIRSASKNKTLIVHYCSRPYLMGKEFLFKDNTILLFIELIEEFVK